MNGIYVTSDSRLATFKTTIAENTFATLNREPARSVLTMQTATAFCPAILNNVKGKRVS